MVLERLADDLEERQLLKAKLIGAMLYPAIVTLVAIVIVLFLVGYVVPQVANVFAGTKRALPFLTTAMLGLSSGVRQYGWLMLPRRWSWAVRFGLRMSLRNESFREPHSTPPGWVAGSGQAVARIQRGALCQHAGHAGFGSWRAHPEGAASRRRNPQQPRHAADALDALVLVREGAPLASAMARRSDFPACSACSPAWANKPGSCR
jgi:general secretion pathway protein F